ncbi:MAG: glycine zipper 2TM domain-containing protein [Novosphingobium sp.]
MRALLSKAALAAALPATLIAAAPALAAPAWHGDSPAASQSDQGWNHGRKRGHHKHRGYDGDYGYRSYGTYGGGYRSASYDDGYYGEPVYRSTRVWQGDDGRYYCRRSNGTTGLIVGAAAGALLGREVAGYRGDRTLGAILGGAAGALLGREIDRGGSRCR